LKSGITENKDIIKFLEENEVVLKGRTFDRYKSIAEGELENDLDANIWLDEKVHSALIHDYKSICDRYDRQLLLDDLLIEGLIKKSRDEAVEKYRDPDKYYRNLDIYSIIRVQEASDQAMKNKIELISKGFITYRIKRYIDHLQEQLKEKEKEQERIVSSGNVGVDRDVKFELAPHLKELEQKLGKKLSDLE